jgi:hypothetical protein
MKHRDSALAAMRGQPVEHIPGGPDGRSTPIVNLTVINLGARVLHVRLLPSLVIPYSRRFRDMLKGIHMTGTHPVPFSLGPEEARLSHSWASRCKTRCEGDARTGRCGYAV